MKIRVYYCVGLMRKLFQLLLCVLFPSLLFADNVTVEQAQSLAINFFKAGVPTRSISPQVQLIWNGEDASTRTTEAPAFYVFNRTDQKGFIIVSGDDVSMPVLGYSLKNEFKAENMPDNLKAWLYGLRQQINDVRKRNVKASAKAAQSWANASASVGNVERQLQTAQWNQDAPYDYYCPMINSRRAVTGCVATALAIVMRYYQWPDKGIGTLPDYTYQINGSTREQKGHALGHAYNWNVMSLEYSTSSYTQSGAREVAQLIYDCGVMSKATYTDVSTGAYTTEAIQGLCNYMKYGKQVKFIDRTWYSDTKWCNMLREEIKQNGPVLYSGSNAQSEGHQFVLDGYTSNGYFGVNWGWGGYANGYFLISSLDPYETGIGGGSGGGFLYNHAAVLGLKPAQDDSDFEDFLMLGSGTSQDGTMYNGLSTDETEFVPNRYFLVTVCFIWNMGFNVFNGEGILSLVDEEGDVKEDISDAFSITRLEPYGGIGQICSCHITRQLSGGDRIWVRYRSSNSMEWKRLEGIEGTVSEIIVMDPGDEKNIEESTSFSYSKSTKAILLTTKSNVTYKLTSTSGQEMLSGKTNSNNLEIRISTEQFSAGNYKLLLQKGSDIKELNFVIGKQK